MSSMHDISQRPSHDTVLTAHQAGSLGELLPVLQDHLKLSSVPLSVHRLDRPVTGALMLALTPQSARTLSSQLRAREVGKDYLAVVKGDVARMQGRSSGTVQCWLRRKGKRSGTCEAPPSAFVSQLNASDGRKNKRMQRSEDVQVCPTLCTTDWDAVGYSPKHDLTLVSLHLITGFYHQLRVHCASVLRTPILGDTAYDPALSRYHAVPGPKNNSPANDLSQSATELPRLMLHASLLSLHQYRREAESSEGKRFRLTVRAPLPPEFVGICESARLKLTEAERKGGVWVDGALRSSGDGMNRDPSSRQAPNTMAELSGSMEI